MSARPLSGLLVVDLTRHLPGPLTARLLADLGARVVKVEEPGEGDPVRRAPPARGGLSALAGILLAGVESVALDLKSEPARGLLERLLDRADVLLESFRPGTMKRLGLDPEELRERYPRLVVCSISGWGEEGPGSGRAGHDLTYQAVAGSLAPTASMPAAPNADLQGAWAAATAVLAALLARERSGRGERIDASLLDAALHGNLTGLAAEAKGRQPVGAALPLSGALPCYSLYPTRDGRWLAVAALETGFWQTFCEAAGRPDLVADQYSDEPAARRRVAELVAGRDAAAWQELAELHDLPVETVLSAAEALEHPQVASRRVVRAAIDGLPRVGFPARIGGMRPAAADEVPELGQDTDRLVDELGAPESGWSRRERRRAGIGPRFSARRWLWRLVSS